MNTKAFPQETMLLVGPGDRSEEKLLPAKSDMTGGVLRSPESRVGGGLGPMLSQSSPGSRSACTR